MKKAVIGVVSTRETAELIAQRLLDAGFTREDISVLFPDKRSTAAFAHERHTKAPEGIATGVGAGGVVGGTLGLLAGIGALAIPGLGFFIAAGPIMATLSGLAAGVTVGGLTQALVGMGIPEYEAKMYESKLRSDNILMAVHTDDGADRSCAAEVFKSSGVTDVATQTESAAPARTLRPSDA